MALPMVFMISVPLNQCMHKRLYPSLFFVRNPTLQNFVDLCPHEGFLVSCPGIFQYCFTGGSGHRGYIIFASVGAYPLTNMTFILSHYSSEYNSVIDVYSCSYSNTKLPDNG